MREEVRQLSADMKAKVDMARDRLHATCVADILYHPHQHTDICQALLQVRDFIQRGGGNTENLPKALGKRFAAAFTKSAALGQEAVAGQDAAASGQDTAALGQDAGAEAAEAASGQDAKHVKKMKKEKKEKHAKT